ncbi:hypothetical protein [Vagococcus jeotgali]|uniref:hypothetical protein n=1 Tax=Vagococcus jeotgali TaxID=3109030 RepID=UPI002DD9855B|nr:hypothetical protein [Vagococcus sp. B2T-5]
MDEEPLDVLKEISKSLKTLAEVNKANEINKYNTIEIIKDSALVFILGIVVGCMLFQLGTM